jgi:hypothetical protein
MESRIHPRRRSTVGPLFDLDMRASKAKIDARAILMLKEFAGPFLLNGPASFSCPDAPEHPSS